MSNDVSGLLTYKTTVNNCDGSYDLVVAASSAKEAAELFVKELKSEKWKKIAEKEFREALDDWESLNDDERRESPTLPYYVYGWIIQAKAKWVRKLEPIIDAHISVWDQNSNEAPLGRRRTERRDIEKNRIVQILGGSGNLVRYHRRFD